MRRRVRYCKRKKWINIFTLTEIELHLTPTPWKCIHADLFSFPLVFIFISVDDPNVCGRWFFVCSLEHVCLLDNTPILCVVISSFMNCFHIKNIKGTIPSLYDVTKTTSKNNKNKNSVIKSVLGFYWLCMVQW